jgi:hypothetical protein
MQRRSRMEDRGDGGKGRPGPSLVGPIILIAIGVLALLSTAGVLQFSLWSLWRLWPLLLILWGVETIFSRSRVGYIISLVITVLLVGGVTIGLVAYPELLGVSERGVVERFAEPMDGAERVDLDLDFAGGQLSVGPLVDSPDLVDVQLQLATGREPIWEVSREDDQVHATLGYEGGDWTKRWFGGDEWRLTLAPTVGISMVVNMGVGRANLDLRDLEIRELSVDSGPSWLTIRLPDRGDVSASVTVGVGGLVLEIPESMAARIRVQQGLVALEFPARFERADGLYLTDDWEDSESRVDLSIDVGVGIVIVRES